MLFDQGLFYYNFHWNLNNLNFNLFLLIEGSCIVVFDMSASLYFNRKLDNIVNWLFNYDMFCLHNLFLNDFFNGYLLIDYNFFLDDDWSLNVNVICQNYLLCVSDYLRLSFNHYLNWCFNDDGLIYYFFDDNCLYNWFRGWSVNFQIYLNWNLNIYILRYYLYDFLFNNNLFLNNHIPIDNHFLHHLNLHNFLYYFLDLYNSFLLNLNFNYFFDLNFFNFLYYLLHLNNFLNLYLYLHWNLDYHIDFLLYNNLLFHRHFFFHDHFFFYNNLLFDNYLYDFFNDFL